MIHFTLFAQTTTTNAIVKAAMGRITKPADNQIFLV
jgi:hypothetical protein